MYQYETRIVHYEEIQQSCHSLIAVEGKDSAIDRRFSIV